MGSRVLRYPRASQNLSRASPERLPKPVESVSKASQPEPTDFLRLLQSLSTSAKPDVSAAAGNDQAVSRTNEESTTTVSDDVSNVYATAANAKSGII